MPWKKPVPPQKSSTTCAVQGRTSGVVTSSTCSPGDPEVSNLVRGVFHLAARTAPAHGKTCNTLPVTGKSLLLLGLVKYKCSNNLWHLSRSCPILGTPNATTHSQREQVGFVPAN